LVGSTAIYLISHQQPAAAADEDDEEEGAQKAKKKEWRRYDLSPLSTTSPNYKYVKEGVVEFLRVCVLAHLLAGGCSDFGWAIGYFLLAL
jgi:hypothetical protein